MKELNNADHDATIGVPHINPDDITVSEGIKLLGDNAPTPPAIYRAVDLGKIPRAPDRPDKKLRYSRTGLLKYVEDGGFKKSGRSGGAGTRLPRPNDDEALPKNNTHHSMKDMNHTDHNVIADVTAADDYISAAEALKLRGSNRPTPPAFYSAIKNGKIRKKPGTLEHGKIMVSRAASLDYFMTFKKPGGKTAVSGETKTAKAAIEPVTESLMETAPMAVEPSVDAIVEVPSPRAELVPSEVVADIPDSISNDVTKEIDDATQFLAGLEKMPDDELLTGIKSYASRAKDFASRAVGTGSRALVNAWACGTMLNAAKARLGHGTFGAWRDEHLKPAGTSKRTSQRYMNLAKTSDDVRALLESPKSLRQVYIACGIIPAPDRKADAVKDEVNEKDKDPSPRTSALIAGLSSLQKILRLFTTSDEELGKSNLRQLELMRDELNRFFNQILPARK